MAISIIRKPSLKKFAAILHPTINDCPTLPAALNGGGLINHE
jgi:hypothetical protein